jgi:hypothetical protein
MIFSPRTDRQDKKGSQSVFLNSWCSDSEFRGFLDQGSRSLIQAFSRTTGKRRVTSNFAAAQLWIAGASVKTQAHGARCPSTNPRNPVLLPSVVVYASALEAEF